MRLSLTGAFVHLLTTLYFLAILGCCHYIPGSRNNIDRSTEEVSSKTYQKCGAELTSFLSFKCNHTFFSPSLNNYPRLRRKRQIAQLCCKRACSDEMIYSFCLQGSSTEKTNDIRKENDIEKSIPGASNSNAITNRDPKQNQRFLGNTENHKKKVRVSRRKKTRRKKHNYKRQKKSCYGSYSSRRRVFRRICEFPSFAHFLLKLEKNIRVSNDIKRNDAELPPMEYGTISPDIDTFGGNPVIVVSQTNRSKTRD